MSRKVKNLFNTPDQLVFYGNFETKREQSNVLLLLPKTKGPFGTVKFENYNGGLGEIRAQVESGAVIWDVVDVLPDQAITGCDEGLFEDISAEYDNFTPAPDGTGMIEDMANSGVTIYLIVVLLKFSGVMLYFMIQLISQVQNLKPWQIFMILQSSLVKEEFILGHKLTSKWHLLLMV